MAHNWSLFKFIKSYYTASLVPQQQHLQQQTEENVSLTSLKNQMINNKKTFHATSTGFSNSKNQLASQMNMFTSFSPIHLDYKLSHN